MKKILLLLPLLLLVSLVNAQSIWSSDANGNLKNFFYTNESVYATSSNISNNATVVDIYVFNNSNSWASNTSLASYVSATKSVSTNSSGYLLPKVIWVSPQVGDYDIVLDFNHDGNYTSNVDYVYNLTTAGFSVLGVPVPTLIFSVGNSSPPNHRWSLGNMSENSMLQLKIKADYEDIAINSFTIIASGSGDDKNGISLIRLVTDESNNGIYETNETTIGYGKFINNDGVLEFPVQSAYTLSAGASNNFLFLYTMSNSSSDGNTFSFQVISSSASGKDSGKTAKLLGLPIYSAIKTVSIGALNQTMNCSIITNNTSCSGAGCNWCNSTNVCKNASESCVYTCSGSIELSLEEHGEISTARIYGLSNCDGKIAHLKQLSCNGLEMGSCSISGNECWVSFSTPGYEGNYTYSACVDKDANGSFSSEEAKLSVLTVSKLETAKPSFDWNKIILLIAVALLVASVVFIILWLKKTRTSKQYSYKFKP
ncbi:MAG TPA: hypothetical protein VJ343_00320 [archaeon]|nr:hypothetical protein [archaeon]